MLVSSVVSSYGDKIEVGYDSSWRVKTVKRYVGENLCNVLSLSYNEGSTAVSSVDYISSKPVGEIKTGYVFSRDGKLLSEFEINDGSSLASALDAKFVSDTDYERYVYSLNPSLCRKGELYAETQNETVGYFSVTAPSKQERYVLYARIDSQSVFDGIENGYVDIAVALDGLTGDTVASVSFRSDGRDIQVACCPVNLEKFSFAEPLWFTVSGNANFGKVKIEDISMCLVPREGRADFIKSDTATGMKITEYKKEGNTDEKRDD